MTVQDFITNALAEDIGSGDHTSLACIPAQAKSKAHLLVKENGILAGIEIAKQIFKQVDASLTLQIFINDGATVKKGDVAFHVEGKAQSILKAERLVLNCMQRMSGIATSTRAIVSKLEGLPTKVLDTRKTTPGMRLLEKMAVKIGGGENHRFGLYDMIMIKDNHSDYAGGVVKAIVAANEYLKLHHLNLKIEVEARNLAEVNLILSTGNIHRIMLDNFSIADLKTAVALINRKYETEASGGITIETIRDYALCGVDYISVGALTHSVKSIDLSLKAI
ncbi:MAG: carboxylating nicotinate-nucleotide diphosphorylase [Bacteroidetes bacterium]|nr:carboxylating nicotinate-nucleotide diphosphorylase [Bacteroidota bacterium]MBK9800611.1 carboxylating nicotinate-nucleotide diphosphorylase [Bacteroidota bacterium]MBP6411973.1 carboxylating nicotinate-nucleotide diphosphorylase [Bacteroidia bacterium]